MQSWFILARRRVVVRESEAISLKRLARGRALHVASVLPRCGEAKAQYMLSARGCGAVMTAFLLNHGHFCAQY